MTFEEAEKEISKIIVGEQYKILDILGDLQETYEAENQEVLKLKNQIEISKAYFKNILDVEPNIMPKSIGHLRNCVHVMKISAEKALKHLDKIDEQ